MKKLVTVIVYVFVYVQFHLSMRIYYVTCYSYTLCIHYLWSTIKKMEEMFMPKINA